MSAARSCRSRVSRTDRSRRARLAASSPGRPPATLTKWRALALTPSACTPRPNDGCLTWPSGTACIVMVGIPWEQHVAFLQTGAAHGSSALYVTRSRLCAAIRRSSATRSATRSPPRSCAGTGATDRALPRAAGSCGQAGGPRARSSPTSISRPRSICSSRSFDLLAFNVYLERREQLERYLARLQNIADDRPLLIGELGLDSRRNGLEQQASSLSLATEASRRRAAQVPLFSPGPTVAAEVGRTSSIWDFGLTTRTRRPKPALDSVRRAFLKQGPERGAAGAAHLGRDLQL